MSSSSKIIFPESLGKFPAIILNNVVLPAPLGPIKPVIEPLLIFKETLFTALIPPKFLEIF